MKKKKKIANAAAFAPEQFVPLILLILTAVLFVIRITGPTNLLDNDQERPAAYILDATVQHHWICQRDWSGDITSKPPLYTWLGAISTMTIGRGTINLVTLYLPCFLAVLGTALLMFKAGRRLFGWQVAALGAAMFVISPMGMKQVALARTDPLFAFTVTLTAFAGYYAWTRGKGWVWFWLAAALSGLTKGPLGLILASGGFVSWFWNRKTGTAQPAFHWHNLLGIVLYLGIVGGWFWMAYHVEGEALYNKMIRSELVNHAVSTEYGVPGSGLLKTPAHLLTRFLPWSIFGIFACILVFRHPAANEEERRLERFLTSWILVGCVVLGLGTHQRGDLIFPLIPPLSLLAGRWLSQLLTGKFHLPESKTLRVLIFGGMIGLMFIACYNRFVFSMQLVTAESRAMEKVASNIRSAGFDVNQLHHWQTRFALQFNLNTMVQETTTEELLPLLQAETPVLLTVPSLEEFTKAIGDSAPTYRVVYKWYMDGKPFLFLIANNAWTSKQTSLNSSTRYFNSKKMEQE